MRVVVCMRVHVSLRGRMSVRVRMRVCVATTGDGMLNFAHRNVKQQQNRSIEATA